MSTLMFTFFLCFFVFICKDLPLFTLLKLYRIRKHHRKIQRGNNSKFAHLTLSAQFLTYLLKLNSYLCTLTFFSILIFGAGDQILWKNGNMKKIKKNQSDETIVWMCITCACTHACACGRACTHAQNGRARMHTGACIHKSCTSRWPSQPVNNFLFSL